MKDFTKGIIFTLVTVTTGRGLYRLGKRVGQRKNEICMDEVGDELKELLSNLEEEEPKQN